MSPIKIGTDCSGMEAPIQAIRNLKVDYKHAFSCDINKYARATIEANFPHARMYHDLTQRDNESAPKTDLYVAGFPCQPFSLAGKQQGFKDQLGRGMIFFHVLDYIDKQRPRVFVLENVQGLEKIKGGEYLEAIMKELENLGGYNVYWETLNTKEHGIPHNRKRWYCVGIAQAYDNGSFKFPAPIKYAPLEEFLDKRNPKLAAVGLPVKTATTAVANVKLARRTLKKQGYDPDREPWVIDCDSSTYRFGYQNGVVPCITCSRGQGHWVTNRGRRLNKYELMRLQGMDPTKFKVAVSESQLGKQLGNTMSVNVLERLFVKLLPAAKLAKKEEVRDRWANGQAVRKLRSTRGCEFRMRLYKKGVSAKCKAAAARTLKRQSSDSSTSSKGSKRKRLS